MTCSSTGAEIAGSGCEGVGTSSSVTFLPGYGRIASIVKVAIQINRIPRSTHVKINCVVAIKNVPSSFTVLTFVL